MMKSHNTDNQSYVDFINALLGSLILTILAFILRYFFQPYLADKLPLLFFIFSAMGITSFFSLRFGLISLLSGLFLAYYFFTPPFNSFEIPDMEHMAYLLGKFFLGIILVFVFAWFKQDAKNFIDGH